MTQIANAGAAAGLDTVEVTLVPSASKKPRNVARNRSDNLRKYGVSVDGSPLKTQCKFCHKTVSGGEYRFKHHLAGTPKDTGACLAVPEKVKKEMLQIVTAMQSRLIKRTRTQMEEMKIF